MNKKALWFGVKANIASLIANLALFLISSSLIIKPDYLGNLYRSLLIDLIISAISFYLALSVILKNSKDSKKEKTSGINYTFYVYLVLVAFNLLLTKSPIGYALILAFNAVSVGIVYLVCMFKIRKLPNTK